MKIKAKEIIAANKRNGIPNSAKLFNIREKTGQ
jgi:hypothetical protein